MRGGYVRNALALIGALTVFVAAGFAAWEYRRPIVTGVRSVAGQELADAPPQEPSVGVPSDAALRSALRKEELIARRDGAEHVRLTADEMASIIQSRLDPVARRALDSLRLSLTEKRVTLDGQVLMDVFSGELLGPLAGYVHGRQPIRVGGPVAVRDTGMVSWTPDEVTVMALPLPHSAIPRLVNYLTGGSEGQFILPVPRTVGDVEVGPSGVTFYRWDE
jgi:hypothetical protein